MSEETASICQAGGGDDPEKSAPVPAFDQADGIILRRYRANLSSGENGGGWATHVLSPHLGQVNLRV